MNAKHFIAAAEIAALDEKRVIHPLNANTHRLTRSLGDVAGMRTLGVHMVRVEPGRDTTEYHFHHAEEEFLYILGGRGTAEVGDETFDVGPGDFLGFPAGGPAHVMRNPGPGNLACLMVGERRDGDAVG